MKSFNEILKGVASTHVPADQKPTAGEPSVFAKALGRVAVTVEPEPIAESGMEPGTNWSATPGDGNDPTSALNHTADQHHTMHIHTAINQHLQTAKNYLDAAHELIKTHPNRHAGMLGYHLGGCSNSMDGAAVSIQHATDSLSSANKEALK
jgi:hypothetical protein